MHCKRIIFHTAIVVASEIPPWWEHHDRHCSPHEAGTDFKNF